MSNDVIVFSELELVSKTGVFYYQIGIDSPRVMKTDEETFKNMLVASAKTLSKAKLKYGDNSPQTDKARRTYMYYENQIDISKGDMFTALLYPVEQWVAIQY